MTTITIFRDQNKDCIGFEMKGHAGYAESGSDIVCAAISILAINTQNSVEKFTGDHFGQEADEQTGYMYFMLEENPSTQVFVVPGFIASDSEGRMTTLGRGGSDYSASLLAVGSNARLLEIWTDVPGIMTANPKEVPAARTIPEISYQSALDMATHGAKVLYAPTVKPAMEAGIAIRILNTFEPGNPGTTVLDLPKPEVAEWMGVTLTEDSLAGEALLCLVSNGNINGKASCERVEDSLRKAGIRTLSVSSDGTNVYATVRLAVEDEALRAIHAEFFESVPLSTVNLFIAGYGAVGKAFVKMIGASAGTVAERTGKTLRIAGISNSRRFAVDLKGIAPEDVPAALENGIPASGGGFFRSIKEVAPRKSIFVDLTSGDDIYKEYEGLLREGFNIVTSNRKALAVPYVEYAAMMSAAQENGVFLRHETTVGSALPVLESVARSANSCDEIVSLEAVVSCTLNKILSSYARYPGSFAETVRRAQEEGLTEPDPRVDLSGRDALRKLLILAREAGVPMDEDEVQVQPLLDDGYFGIPLEDFYRRLEADEPRFDAMEKAAARSHCRQRFVASLQRDPKAKHGYSAVIGVRNVPRSHPAFRIMGSENAIIVRSSYHPYPMLIQGAGEGPNLAASSVLNDILR